MTDSFATWIASVEASPEQPALVALISGDSQVYACREANPEFARALGHSLPELVGANLRQVLGPATFDAQVRPHIERALAGQIVRSQLRVDLPGSPQALLESLLMPAPAGAAPTGDSHEVLWLATDISRAARLRDACLELGRRLAAHGADTAQLEADLTRDLAHATGSGCVELWWLTSNGEQLERAVGYNEGSGARSSPMEPGEHLAALSGEQPFTWSTTGGGDARSALALPVHSQGRARGLLLLDEPAAGAPWTPDERRWLSEVVALLGAAQGRDARRVSDRREAVQQTRAQLASMARGIAHDFNNLLVGILGGLELAFQEIEPNSGVHGDLQLIHKSATRAARLCHAMLAYAGGRHGRRFPIQLGEIVRNATAGSGARLELERGLGPLSADPDQMHQIVDALLANATEAVEGEADAITVRTEGVAATNLSLEDKGWVLQPRTHGGMYQRLEVIDRGRGIPERVLERVFEPFFTTRPGASGLGLAAVLGLVESLSGGVHIRSVTGQGTSVSVVLPESNGQQTAPVPPRTRTGPVRVLVIDDDASVLETLSRMLRANGCDVLSASDPLIAVELFERAESPIDAAVVDVEMPGIDGVETVERLRRIDPNLHAVLVSGYSPSDRAGGNPDDSPGGSSGDSPGDSPGDSGSEPGRDRSYDAAKLDPPVAFLQKPFATADLLGLLPSPHPGAEDARSSAP